MSRRRSMDRILDPGPTTELTAEQAIDFFTDAGIPMWFATRMPEPWDRYLWHQWPHAWAEYTMHTAETVWRNTGARLYDTHRDHDLRDDLRDWLLVKAVEAGTEFTPDPWHPAPERQYAAWLYGSLKHRARNHFSDVVGYAPRSPKAAAGIEARKKYGPSLEAQQEALDGPGKGVVYTHGPMWTRAFEDDDPASVIIKLEDLQAQADDIDRQGLGATFYTSAGDYCLVNLCTKPPVGRGLCRNHYNFERNRAVDRGDWQTYTPPATCEEDGCTEGHYSRGKCRLHYERHKAKVAPCSVGDCTNGSHAKGMCMAHYMADKRARTPTPCSLDGCDRPVRGRGLCGSHYEEVRLSEAPPCSVEDCTAPAKSKGMCGVHYNRARRQDAPPCEAPGCTQPRRKRGGTLCQDHHKEALPPKVCEVPDCEDTVRAKGLCPAHYRAERRGDLQR
ncbi:hypothetical protein [Ornithinimicrobium sp. W1665]|uniref:hypothetical protein n=1 Tax=Ornithinimicrobium sp. W1665 TaxID=3416666 RepID=UPI003CE7A57C